MSTLRKNSALSQSPSLMESVTSRTKMQLVDQLKTKLVNKYGREASPTIEKCVSQMLEKQMVKPQDFLDLENEINIMVPPKQSKRLDQISKMQLKKNTRNKTEKHNRTVTQPRVLMNSLVKMELPEIKKQEKIKISKNDQPPRA